MSFLSVEEVRSLSTDTPPIFANSLGKEYGKLCKAFVSFDGTTLLQALSSFNISSITHNSTGSYTINFDIPFPDANYVVIAMAMNEAGEAKLISSDNETNSVTSSTIQCETDMKLINIIFMST